MTITHLGRFGDGVVSEPDAPPLYVAGALPGERARIGATVRDRRILRAPLREVLVASPARRAPTCDVVARCGGCPLAHLSRQAQLEAKRGWLVSELAAKGLDPQSITIELALPEPGTAYRARARLAWSPRGPSAGEGGGAVLGYRESERHDVVVPSRCVVLAPALEAARVRLTSTLGPLLAGTGELRLALSRTFDGEHVVAALDTQDPQPAALYRALEALVSEGALGGARLRVGSAGAVLVGETIERSTDPEGRVLRSSIGGFRQAHVGASSALGERVLAWGRPEGARVIELHAGHGHFTLSLAARASHVVAVELEGEAAQAMRENLAAHGLRAEALADDAARALGAIAADVARGKQPRPDLVVLDPPRTGALDVMQPLGELAPTRVVYVSCDVATFARDVAALRPRLGLERLTLVDLFPDTLHVELVALLTR
ncbi:MAG: RsmD family RNA methyltransferase [Sandaracinaceae bacterium]|nr:RsmD family RNA methyltransferase [Sandaracinaceae bacterium]